MHTQLENYLNAVAKSLSMLPIARRNEELRELREHLLNAIAVNRETGQTEDDAVTNALKQFGGHKELGQSVVSAWRRGVWKRWANAPPEVILFAVYSLGVTLFHLWLTFAGPKLWREAVFPYIGGSLSTPYGFSLFFAWQAIFAPTFDPKALRGPIGFLLMYAAFGTREYLWMSHLPNFHNPYLTASPWQPVWTVALPLAWALVLGICPIIRGRKARQTARL